MSDKVKVIIEIPKYDYKEVRRFVAEGIFDYDGVMASACKAIANGTPLDGVKAESEDKGMTKEDILHHFQDINFYYNDCMMYDELSRMLDELIAENDVLRIINNIGKAESEETDGKETT